MNKIMNIVKALAQREPALTGTGLAWAAGALCAVLGHPEFSPILVAAGLAFLGIRTQVTPVVKAQEGAISAAQTAATTTAENLTSASAGKVGEITDRGQQVIDDAVGLVKGLL